MNPKIYIKLEDKICSVFPVVPEITKKLTVSDVKYVCTEATHYINTPIRTNRNIFQVATTPDGNLWMYTFQGLWELIKKTAEKAGYEVNVIDNRATRIGNGFRKPQLDKMAGFRFSQGELVRTMLSADMNGMLIAPTRYGKTYMIINTIRAYPGVKTLVALPGVDLVRQMYDDIKDALKDRDVTMLGAGSRKVYQGEDVTVASMDSLHKCDHAGTELLIVDEPHTCPTDSRLVPIDTFPHRRLAFTATPSGRSDGRDILIRGLFGPTLAEISYKDAVEEGAICPIVILFLKIPVKPEHFRDRNAAYNKIFFKNKGMADLIAHINKNIIPKDWQTFTFIVNEAQADMCMESIKRDSNVAMAKLMTNAQRKEMTRSLAADEIKRVFCTNIYIQGVTFHQIRCIINAAAGGNNTSAIQKPGRLAEVIEGKKAGIVIDFNFVEDSTCLTPRKNDNWRRPIADSKSRRKAYTDKGYKIIDCEDVHELAYQLFKETL
ncbi:MAG: DEAD/DEAH box helicase family protein [Tannerellaceae bacterium]